MAILPEESDLGGEESFFPAFVISFQAGKKVVNEGKVGMDLVSGPDGIGKPGAVVSGLSARGFKPVAAIILRISVIAEPAGFIKLMSCGARDCAVGARPKRAVDEFGE